VQAVQYAMREHGMSEEEALDRLDSMQADLGLTVHQTAEALRVVRSLLWQVHQWVPEHSAASPSEECAGSYPPTQLANGKDTPVPGATRVTALQAVRAAKAWSLVVPQHPRRVLVRRQAAQHAARAVAAEAQAQQGRGGVAMA
jgi:hypothetical protein